jgi:predicted exporter
MPSRRPIAAMTLATVAGLAMLQIDSTVVEAIGAVLVVGVILIVIGLTVVRLGPQSQPERDSEARARDEFDRTGRWPTE